MSLFYGVLCLCLAAICGAALMIAGRHPQPPKWAGEFLLADFYVPLWLCLIIGGLAFLTHWGVVLGQESLSWPSIAASVGAVIATVVGLKSMRVGQRLAAFAAREASRTAAPSPLPFTPPDLPPEKPAPHSTDRQAA